MRISIAKNYCMVFYHFTNWGRVAYIYIGNLTINASDNGFGRHQAFNENLIKIHTFLLNKMHLKMLYTKMWLFFLGLNVLRVMASMFADNGLVPAKTIIWSHAGILLIRPLQWKLNKNSYIFIELNAFENVVHEMVTIFSRPQCFKGNAQLSRSRCNPIIQTNDNSVLSWIYLPIIQKVNIKNQWLSWYQLYLHWLHQSLSQWQPSVLPLKTKLASWWLSVFCENSSVAVKYCPLMC